MGLVCLAVVRALLVLSVALAAFGATAQERRVLPPDPREGETVAIVGAYPYVGTAYFTTATAQREGGTFTVTQPKVPGGGPTRWSRFGATIDGLGVGTYTIRGGPYSNLNAAPFDTPPFELTVSVAPGTPATPQFSDLDGNWFDPGQPGWGVNVVQGDSGALFAVVLGYAGRTFGNLVNFPSAWLVMPAGRWASPTTFRGLLYESIGTRLTAEPRSNHVSVVGMATVEILTQDRMRVSIIRATYNGEWIEGSWTLQRFAF